MITFRFTKEAEQDIYTLYGIDIRKLVESDLNSKYRITTKSESIDLLTFESILSFDHPEDFSIDLSLTKNVSDDLSESSYTVYITRK